MDLAPGDRPPLISLSTLQQLSQDIRSQLEQWLRSGDSLSIFVSGKTGGGKSALVNALLGGKFAEEGAGPDPMTAGVTPYIKTIKSIRVTIWDSPGLQDGTGNEERYLADIKAKCMDIDLFLFCINVGDTIKFHLDSPEVKALVKLTETLGHSLWKHAIIALTFANRLGQKSSEMRMAKKTKNYERLKELFCTKISEWDENLRAMLQRIGLDSELVARLKIVPTGFHNNPSLPDRPHWLSTFWFSVLRSTHKRAQPALLAMNETRIVENPDSVDDESRKQHTEDQEFICRDYGSAIGAPYGLKDIGSFVGVTVSHLKTCQLKEVILLEQHFLFNIIEQTPRSASIGMVDRLTTSMSSTLSSLTCGTSSLKEIPNSVDSSIETLSPRSECGGDPYS